MRNDVLKILLLEDNKSDLKLVKFELKKAGIEFISEDVDNKSDFVKQIDLFEPDIVLSDYSLPQFNGMEALKVLTATGKNIPFILVTGSLNEEIAVECMKAGAEDYILKDNLTRLGHAVDQAMKRKIEREEKQRANKELRESEERYRLLFEITPDVIVIHCDGKIVFANNAAAKIARIKNPQDLIGKEILSFVHPDFHETSIQRIKRLLQDNVVTPPIEEKLVFDYGVVDVEIVETRFPYRETQSILTIVRDISERKLFEKRLIEAKTKAEESNKFKATLLANLSHEFRTPMNGILGFSMLLKDEINDDIQKSMVDNIIVSSKRLMSTLSSILDLSLIEANNLEIKYEKNDLNCCAFEIYEKYKDEFDLKNINLVFSKHYEEISCNVDRALMCQIINNIIDNSLKFTHKGKVEILVDHSNIDNINYGFIKIKDTGIGIANEHKELIFEPFRQVSEGTNRTYEGSGLGLTIARKLTLAMKGKILLESTPGEGSTFTIMFPLLNQIPKKTNEEVFTFHRKEPLVVENKFKVLLIEDNFINKEVVKHYLKDYCSIDHASNGEKAVELCKKNHFQILLVDIHLGLGLDGIETLKRIKKLNDYENVLSVAITGYAMRADKDRMLEAGFDYYLPKPFEQYDLIEILTKINDRFKKEANEVK